MCQGLLLLLLLLLKQAADEVLQLLQALLYLLARLLLVLYLLQVNTPHIRARGKQRNASSCYGRLHLKQSLFLQVSLVRLHVLSSKVRPTDLLSCTSVACSHVTGLSSGYTLLVLPARSVIRSRCQVVATCNPSCVTVASIIGAAVVHAYALYARCNVLPEAGCLTPALISSTAGACTCLKRKHVCII
jgi:hypothetical protein